MRIRKRTVGRRLADAVACVVVAAGCGSLEGDQQRIMVEVKTCESFLRRSGRLVEPEEIDPARFAAVRAEFIESGRPFSTLDPFRVSCRSLG